MERGGAAISPEKHLPARALKTRAPGPAGQISAWETINDRVVLECLSQRIEPRYSFVGAHPEIASFIFENAAHHVARQAIPLVVGCKVAGLAVELVEAV